jgi:hypothetical protein
LENPAGPGYSISRDKIETITYKKGTHDTQNYKPKETEKETIASQPAGYPQLVVKKRYVYLNDVKQNSRSVKTIMEDHLEEKYQEISSHF